MNISPYSKAVAAFIGAALTAYLGAQDGGVTSQEWIQIILAGLGGAGLIYAVPNKDPKAQHQDESVQPPNARGAVDALFLVAFVVLVIVVLLFFGFHGHH